MLAFKFGLTCKFCGTVHRDTEHVLILREQFSGRKKFICQRCGHRLIVPSASPKEFKTNLQELQVDVPWHR